MRPARGANLSSGAKCSGEGVSAKKGTDSGKRLKGRSPQSHNTTGNSFLGTVGVDYRFWVGGFNVPTRPVPKSPSIRGKVVLGGREYCGGVDHQKTLETQAIWKTEKRWGGTMDKRTRLQGKPL